MKKLLSILMMLTLLLSIGVTAYAEGEASVTPDTVTVTKEYTLTGGDAAPIEELSFTVTPDAGNLGGVTGELVVGEGNKVTTSGEATVDIPIAFPIYSKVGIYRYTISENTGDTLGVAYDETPIVVVVTVTNAQGSTDTATEDALEATVAIHADSADGDKIADTAAFTNTYGLGQLTVTKQVSGNLASNTKKFTIHVSFTGDNAKSELRYSVAGGEEQTLALNNGGASVDVELSSTQSAVFTNIPAGVSYTVEEDSRHTEGAENPGSTEEGYTVSYERSDEEGLIAAGDQDTVTINNEKKTEIQTGISLDSLPYLLIAGVAAAGLATMIFRRRTEE